MLQHVMLQVMQLIFWETFILGVMDEIILFELTPLLSREHQYL
jgi:hypothetical protein